MFYDGFWYIIEIEYIKTYELELYLHNILKNLPLVQSQYII